MLLFLVVSRGFRQAAKAPPRSSKANSGLILSTLPGIGARLNFPLLLCLYTRVCEGSEELMLGKYDGICHQYPSGLITESQLPGCRLQIKRTFAHSLVYRSANSTRKQICTALASRLFSSVRSHRSLQVSLERRCSFAFCCGWMVF